METEFNDVTNKTYLEDCDLVMKGGVTSGIVYLPLIWKLAQKYRFRSIGGTSAGAILAAATAAAEYNREGEAQGENYFDEFNKLKQELSSGTFLRDLFQPSDRTRPLMNFLLDLLDVVKDKNLKKKNWLVKVPLLTWSLLHHAPKMFVAGAILGATLFYLLAWLMGGSLVGPGLVILVLFSWFFAIILAAIYLFQILTKEVPQNFFGLCTGRKGDTEKEDRTVLTDWLNHKINHLAGRQSGAKPLTFGDLRKKPDSSNEKQRSIMLKMVTSNLSQNQPYTLPFQDHLFIFNENDFCKLFPPSIVEYLKGKHPDHKVDPSKKQNYHIVAPGYYFLPEADDLPVIVATRLSLSFPVLLSAVPLYSIDPAKLVRDKEVTATVELLKEDLQRNWFSDGGIASNFPIHFFDRWLPMRPTFGIKLTSLPKEGFTPDQQEVKPEYISSYANSTQSVTSDQSPKAVTAAPTEIKGRVYLPKANDELLTVSIPLSDTPKIDRDEPVPNLFKFLWAIFATAQNYRDNAQSILPSYRERILQIRLSDDEGGLNLAMSEDTIKKVMRYGEAGGDELTKFNFNIHQWVRFLVLMKQIEKNFDAMQEAMKDTAFYPEFLKKRSLDPDYPYNSRDEQWFIAAEKRFSRIKALIDDWQALAPVNFFEDNSPLPDPVLRTTPEL